MFTSDCCSTPLVVTLTCSLTSVTGSIPRVTAVSGHFGDWVVCDPTISREGQHCGAGSWVRWVYNELFICSGDETYEGVQSSYTP